MRDVIYGRPPENHGPNDRVDLHIFDFTSSPFVVNCNVLLEFSVSQQVGRGPFLGRRRSLLGRQNLCYSSILVVYGSPNCVLFCFVGRQLSNVVNHCSRCYLIAASFSFSSSAPRLVREQFRGIFPTERYPNFVPTLFDKVTKFKPERSSINNVTITRGGAMSSFCNEI